MIDILRSSKEYRAHSLEYTFLVPIASHKFISYTSCVPIYTVTTENV